MSLIRLIRKMNDINDACKWINEGWFQLSAPQNVKGSKQILFSSEQTKEKTEFRGKKPASGAENQVNKWVWVVNNDEPRSSSKRSWQEATSEVRVTLLQISQGGFIEQLVRRGRSLCRTTRGLKQSRVFFHRFLLQVSRSVCVMTTQLICKLLRSKEASAAVDVRTWPPVMDTGTSHTHRCSCADVSTCWRNSWSCVCLFVCSRQMICQRRNLLCCINRPTPTRWPTWTSASPPPACSLELRYTWIHRRRINNRIICVYLSYSGWKQTNMEAHFCQVK